MIYTLLWSTMLSMSILEYQSHLDREIRLLLALFQGINGRRS